MSLFYWLQNDSLPLLLLKLTLTKVGLGDFLPYDTARIVNGSRGIEFHGFRYILVDDADLQRQRGHVES